MKVSNTMEVLEETNIPVEYLVIKFGSNNVFSTHRQKAIESSKDINISKVQIVETIGIGKQRNLWIKGFFTEAKGNKKMETPLPFEINIYLKEY